MQTQYQKVREFMQAFGQECPEKPCLPDNGIRGLRGQLIDEERAELEDATDEVEAFDAILDLLYVVMGAGIAHGFSEEQIAKGLAEVHRSNMSKFWTPTQANARLLQDGDIFIKPTNDSRFVVVTNPSGKIIKSPSYSKANLGPILEGNV